MKTEKRRARPLGTKNKAASDARGGLEGPQAAPYHHGDLKNVAAREAAQMLAESGIDGVSVREIARRIGVSNGALYRHYPDKQALLVDLALQGFQRLGDSMMRAVKKAAADDPRAQLRAALDAYLAFAARHTASFRLMYGPELADRQAYPTLQVVVEDGFALLMTLVGRAQAAGVVRPGEPSLILATALATAHGLAVLSVNGLLRVGSMRDMARSTLFQAVWDHLWVGIGAETQRPGAPQ